MSSDAARSAFGRPKPTRTLHAVTLDYWDTLYVGAASAERIKRRQAALMRMVERVGGLVPAAEFDRLYRESGREAERWWRDEHRGYKTTDRIRWILARLAIERPEECEHIREAVRQVDDAMLEFPPPLLPGAEQGLRALAARLPLGIISDTGFASGDAQNRLLERDGVRDLFAATIYSMDIGHAKPRPEIFAAAAAALGVPASSILHVGDNERTDVAGALAAGLRAVRIDVMRPGGSSAAEYVAVSWEDLAEYLVETVDGRR